MKHLAVALLLASSAFAARSHVYHAPKIKILHAKKLKALPAEHVKKSHLPKIHVVWN